MLSDAVVVIAITLLTLNLRLPQGKSNADLASALGHHSRAFIRFAISFGVIAGNWLSHDSVLRCLVRTDAVLLRLNFVWPRHRGRLVLSGVGADTVRRGRPAEVWRVGSWRHTTCTRLVHAGHCRRSVSLTVLREDP